MLVSSTRSGAGILPICVYRTVDLEIYPNQCFEPIQLCSQGIIFAVKYFIRFSGILIFFGNDHYACSCEFKKSHMPWIL